MLASTIRYAAHRFCNPTYTARFGEGTREQVGSFDALKHLEAWLYPAEMQLGRRRPPSRRGDIQAAMTMGDESLLLSGDATLERDARFMLLAIRQAEIGRDTPGGAHVGCVIVKDGEVVAEGFNEAEGRYDPTAHAEIVTMRRLCADWKTCSLAGCTVYCTLQPCGMCTVACLWAGVQRIVFGATREDVNSIYFATRHANTTDFVRDAFRRDIEVVSGVLAEECAALYLRKDQAVPA